MTSTDAIYRSEFSVAYWQLEKNSRQDIIKDNKIMSDLASSIVQF